MRIDRLIRSRRRTIALIVERDGTLTVRAPMRVARRDIEAFILEKADWIARTRAKMKSMLDAPPRQYAEGESFLFLGSSYGLKLTSPQRHSLKFDEGFHLSRTAQKNAEQHFIRWYKGMAAEIICRRVDEYSRGYNLAPLRVRITSAKTRWGSCSPNGALNFTWRLVMAPIEVIDYVVVHELAHLQVKNHSRRFWNLVESILPDYKHRRKWLRENGHNLNL